MKNSSIDISLIKELKKSPSDIRVVVAMSGGVDSSFVAVALKEKGYDVIGVTLQLYDYGKTLKRKNACCAGIDISDAKKVASQYNFPHYVLNYESLFKESVIDDFTDSYLRGETPVPCIRCNQSVKFDDLFRVAKDLNADFLATGHYIRNKKVGNQLKLYKAVDSSKDQSYFLFTLTKQQLNFLLFPLGTVKKEYVRKEAKRLGLEIASKSESQDICFVPNRDYASFITKLKPKAFKKGDIIHVDTKGVLGEHSGIINYTIGQRKGLNISYKEPLFVVKIDAKENIIFVGNEDHLKNNQLIIKDFNWLWSDDLLQKKMTVEVKLRSSQIPVKAKITANESKIKVILNNPIRAITPGQACVFYMGEEVLGGGWITKEIHNIESQDNSS